LERRSPRRDKEDNKQHYEDLALSLFFIKKKRGGRKSAVGEEYLSNFVVQPLEARCYVFGVIPQMRGSF
jgi:hypothetical protein